LLNQSIEEAPLAAHIATPLFAIAPSM